MRRQPEQIERPAEDRGHAGHLGHILGLSPRTVDKRLEQIYAKNRTAAAAIAATVARKDA